MKTGMPIRSVGLGLSLTSSRPDASWHNREERGREWRVQFTPVKANWLAPVFVPFPQRIRPPTGPAPVEARFGNHAPASRHRIPPAIGAGSLLGQREEGKDGGRGARLVSKPGSHRCRTGGEPERENAKSGQNATN